MGAALDAALDAALYAALDAAFGTTLNATQSLRYLDEKTWSRPEKRPSERSGSMAVDVLTLLTVIITDGAVLLAQSRRDR